MRKLHKQERPLIENRIRARRIFESSDSSTFVFVLLPSNQIMIPIDYKKQELNCAIILFIARDLLAAQCISMQIGHGDRA